MIQQYSTSAAVASVCATENAGLRGGGCLREGGTGVSPLQTTTEKCSADRGGDSPLSELF